MICGFPSQVSHAVKGLVSRVQKQKHVITAEQTLPIVADACCSRHVRFWMSFFGDSGGCGNAVEPGTLSDNTFGGASVRAERCSSVTVA